MSEPTDLLTDGSPEPPPATLTGSADVESEGAAATAAAFGGTVKASGQWSDIRRRFLRNPLAVLGLVIIVGLVLIAIFAPQLAPYKPKHQDLINTESPPSWEHPFGTDVVGRDQLSRVLYGTRIALIVGLSSIVLASAIGVLLGSIAGYFGRFWDSLIMRIADIFFAFPLLVGAILVITLTGQGVLSVIVALGVFGWATISRLLRGSILSVREADYVEAARSLGASSWRIITRHVLPNSLAPVLVFAAFSVGSAVISEAALSYLGVGVSPDVPEWGNMIAAGQATFSTKPWMTLLPCGAVVLTTLAFVFVGDGLRDALDPKLK
jgi:peptide/nickel transport system permease protein